MNTLRYNAISVLTFTYPQSYDNGQTIDPAYIHIQGKMLVFIPDVGYYVIDTCPEDNNGSVPVKNITANSLEAELLGSRVTGFTGEYQFTALLNEVLSLRPAWTIGSIDVSLVPLYRSFSTNNSTIYNFLTKDVQTAYGCVFEFNTFNRTVSAVPNVVPSTSTNIYLSFDNLIKTTEFKEITSEITTGLWCYGAGDMDIHYVNPLGNNVIYNFDYFKTTEWMSQSLIDILTIWENLVDSKQATYSNLLTQSENYEIELVGLEADLKDLNAQLKTDMDIRDTDIQQGINTNQINIAIANQQILVTSKQHDISTVEANLDKNEIALRDIAHSLFFTARISYSNIQKDLMNIATSLSTIYSGWINVYNSTSTDPNFNQTILTAQTYTINTLIKKIMDANDTTLADMATALAVTLIPDDVDTTSLESDLNAEITLINQLYGLLQTIIPITDITDELDSIRTELTAFLDIIYYEGVMTDNQYNELSPYIYENSYTNNNIVITDIMTPADIRKWSQDLYDQAKAVLIKSSQPRYEFTGEFANFVALADYDVFTSELDLGKAINIRKDGTPELNSNRPSAWATDTIEAVLLEMAISYDDPTSFTMTFANALRLDNAMFIYTDILNTAGQLGSSAGGASAITQGSVGGWTVSNSSMGTSNAQINSQGYISFGSNPPSDYGNYVGAYLGYTDTPKFSLFSNINNYLQWDGTRLMISAKNFTLDAYGNITASNAILSGDITAKTGYIGGWTVNSTQIFSPSTIATTYLGIILDSSAETIKIGDTSATYIVLDGINEYIRSSNFVANSSGFNINSDTGDAEFDNIVARGKIKTATFEINTVSAVGGSLMVLNSDVLAADITTQADGDMNDNLMDDNGNQLTDENSNNLTTEMYIAIVVSGNANFAVGDTLRMKGGISGIDDEWFTVRDITQAPLYLADRDVAHAYLPSVAPLWKKGQAIVDYGTSGMGGIYMTSTTTPTFDIFTHNGMPWASLDVHVQLTKDLTLFGSDISSANTTAFSIFHIAQIYNTESMGAGDVLLGSNTSGYANMFWDISMGQLKFRGGKIVQAYVDTDGSIVAGEGALMLGTDGIRFNIPISSTPYLAASSIAWVSGTDTPLQINVAKDITDGFIYGTVRTIGTSDAPIGSLLLYSSDYAELYPAQINIVGYTDSSIISLYANGIELQGAVYIIGQSNPFYVESQSVTFSGLIESGTMNVPVMFDAPGIYIKGNSSLSPQKCPFGFLDLNGAYVGSLYYNNDGSGLTLEGFDIGNSMPLNIRSRGLAQNGATTEIAAQRIDMSCAPTYISVTLAGTGARSIELGADSILSDGTITITLATGSHEIVTNSTLDAASSIALLMQPSFTAAGSNKGAYINPTQTVGATALYGIDARPHFNATNAILSNIYGLIGVPTIEAAASQAVTAAYAGYFRVDNLSTAASVIDTAYGCYIAAPTATGSISTLYGLYIARQTNGAGPLGYAIYTAGSSPIYFGGSITFNSANSITMPGAASIICDATGLTISDDPSHKLSFFGTSPVAQRSAYTQTYSAASRTVPAGTQSSVSDTNGTYGFAVATDRTALVTAINAARTDIIALKQVVNSLIDDSQALGFVTP